MSTNEAFSHDRYLVDQLIRPIANLYRITPLAAGETPLGGPVAFVRQKKMAIKEDIRFFADESETNELFRLKARSVLDTGGSRYDVTDAQGTPVGVLHHLEDPDAGLRALLDMLNDGGALGLMVYARYGRTGVYHMQALMKLVNEVAASRAARIDNTKQMLTQMLRSLGYTSITINVAAP